MLMPVNGFNSQWLVMLAHLYVSDCSVFAILLLTLTGFLQVFSVHLRAIVRMRSIVQMPAIAFMYPHMRLNDPVCCIP